MTREIKGLGERIELAGMPPFRFGPLEVRPSLRELRGNFGRVVLEPRVMQVLIALARADGETVTRDQLIEACWEGRAVSEDAINRAISRLRRLAETTGGWRLETVTKVGYRAVADVAEQPRGPDETTPSLAAPILNRRNIVAGGAVAAAAVLAGAGALLLRRDRPATELERYREARRAMMANTAEGSAQAIGFLRQLVADDPDYGEAWGALSLAYAIARAYAPPSGHAGLVIQARSAAQRALQLNPGDADARAALAALIPEFRNWRASERALDDILRGNPTHAPSHSLRAQVLGNVGRNREALAAVRAAAAGEPASAYRQFTLAQGLWATERLAEADVTVDSALRLWPRNRGLWFSRFWIYTFSGRAAQAQLFGADVSARPVGIPVSDFDLCLVSARAMETGAPADIEAAAEVNLRAAPSGAGYTFNAISVLSSLGRLDDAFTLARNMFVGPAPTTGRPEFSTAQGNFVSADLQTTRLFVPSTSNLRGDARFTALCRDIGLAGYWRASGRRPDDPRIRF
jgi:DNA-binding winged helix-turn-helix (wHTH) protein